MIVSHRTRSATERSSECAHQRPRHHRPPRSERNLSNGQQRTCLCLRAAGAGGWAGWAGRRADTELVAGQARMWAEGPAAQAGFALWRLGRRLRLPPGAGGLGVGLRWHVSGGMTSWTTFPPAHTYNPHVALPRAARGPPRTLARERPSPFFARSLRPSSYSRAPRAQLTLPLYRFFQRSPLCACYRDA